MSRRKRSSVPVDPADEDGTPVVRPPSRSQAKRDAKAMGPLAIRLVQLSARQLKRVELDPDLVEEIVECRPLERTARQRQLKRIAQLLRHEDWRAIQDSLDD